MLLTIVLVLFAISVIGGGLGHARFGYAGWSPTGILLVVLVVLFLTGHLHT